MSKMKKYIIGIIFALGILISTTVHADFLVFDGEEGVVNRSLCTTYY